MFLYFLIKNFAKPLVIQRLKRVLVFICIFIFGKTISYILLSVFKQFSYYSLVSLFNTFFKFISFFHKHLQWFSQKQKINYEMNRIAQGGRT